MNIEDQPFKTAALKNKVILLASRFLVFASLMLIGIGALIMNIVFNFFEEASKHRDEWTARKELVAKGEIEPLNATIVRKQYEKRERTTGIGTDKRTKIDHDYKVELEIATIGPYTRNVAGKVYERITEAQKIQVYPVDGVYVIPALELGNEDQVLHVAKWIFFSLSSLPLILGTIGVSAAVTMKLRRRSAGA